MKYFLLLFLIYIPKNVYSNFPVNLLSSEQLNQLKKNNIIINETEKNLKNGPWPEVQVWVFIKATTLESVGIYYALDYQKEYIPNFIKSTPIKQPTPLITHTEYEYEMTWPIPNGKYINGSKLTKLSYNSYKVNWWLIKNNAAHETTGSATFYPYENNTILYYKTYVHPKTIFARFLKNTMVDGVKVSLLAIKNHIEHLKSKNSPLIKFYGHKITNALRGNYTYIQID